MTKRYEKKELPLSFFEVRVERLNIFSCYFWGVKVLSCLYLICSFKYKFDIMIPISLIIRNREILSQIIFHSY